MKKFQLPRGFGSLRKTKSGTYRLEKLHTFPDGMTKQRISVTEKTPEECIAVMRETEARLDQNFIEEGSMTDLSREILSKSADLWLKQEKEGKVKQTTYDRIERTINNQIKGYEIGTILVRDITSRDITKHLDEIGEKYSYSVVSKTYDFLKQFFDFAMPDKNPMAGIQKPPRNAAGTISDEDEDLFGNSHMADMVLSDDEIKILKDFVYLPPKDGTLGRSKYGLVYYFTLLTFLRSGEIRALKWKDIDVKNKRMQITKTIGRVVDRTDNVQKTDLQITTPKTANGRRIVMLTDEAIDAINTYRALTSLNAPDDFVFSTDNGKPLGEAQTARTLKAILQATGLMRSDTIVKSLKGKKNLTAEQKRFLNAPERSGFGMHYLRHSGISYYLRHGVPIDVISKMAGHSSADITRRIYYHINQNQQTDALSMMNNIGSKKG